AGAGARPPARGGARSRAAPGRAGGTGARRLRRASALARRPPLGPCETGLRGRVHGPSRTPTLHWVGPLPTALTGDDTGGIRADGRRQRADSETFRRGRRRPAAG